MPFHRPAAAGSAGGAIFCWQLHPAQGETASGDDLFAETGRADGSTLFLLVDVTSHGPEAAEVVRFLRERLLPDRACAGRTPAQLLQTLHAMLQPVWAQTGRFVAALTLRVGRDGSVQGAVAGVPPPWGRAAGQAWTIRPISGGVPLGVPMESSYGQTDLPLGPAGMLLACTDGVTEAKDSSGQLYGQGPFGRFLAGPGDGLQAAEILDALLADLREHVGEAWPEDDTTLLILAGPTRS